MDYPTEGGSYTRDPKTGKLTLVHRTEGNAVLTKPAADAAAATPVVDPLTTTKTEKA